MAKITPCFENSKAVVFSNLRNGIGAGTTELHIARPYNRSLNPKYILLFLKAPQFLLIGETKMTGTAGQKRLPKEFFAGNPLPLPPLSEQHRIVAKVDELMALCDQLEQQQTDSITAHQILVETLLKTLTDSENAEQLALNWAVLSEHFDTLFTTEHSIAQLKQTILHLAVMGKLVPQGPNDEPASVLLEKIVEEKARLVKEGKTKQQKILPEIVDDEKLFEIMDGWEWSRLGDLWLDSFYGPRFGKDEYVAHGGYPTIRTTDMTSDGKILLKDPPEILVEESKLSLYGLEKGDLLITRSGSIGTMAIFNLDIAAIPSAYLIRIRLSKPMVPEYVLLMLMSPLGQSYLGLNTTSVGVPNVNATKMSQFVFAIPPEAEQHRIVAKVDELMALCDQLQAQINKAQTTQIHLADAIVEQAIA
ncbi:restriction endonuclease subunit S [Methylotuvimicrobium sp.]|uniref:restriction endonuclease subunit S n=1 Tax=Methylotuvimicrobium sp. TaxID=2822413 RepID=UPI003D650495